MEKAAVRELHSWAAKELPSSRRDEPYLLRFLHGCKMRQETAKSKMRNFHDLQKNEPQWFADRDPNDPILKELLDLGVFMVLPHKDAEGRTIALARGTLHDPGRIQMADVFKLGMMIVDLTLEEDSSMSQNGVIVLVDLTGVQAGHAFQLKSNLIRTVVHAWQNCYPVRIHSFHFINCPAYVSVVVNIFKQFMKEKLRRRVHTYRSNLSSLYTLVPENLLPNELGGNLGPVSEITNEWKSKVSNKRDWFLTQNRH